jgi:osmotically-inducible protein OsmY
MLGFARAFWLVVIAALCVGMYERLTASPPQLTQRSYAAEARRMQRSVNAVDSANPERPYPVDAELSRAVLRTLRMHAADELRGTSISLRSMHREITLVGTTPDGVSRELAGEIAADVTGVVAVHNDLVVRP